MASVTLSYGGKVYRFSEDDQTVLKGRLACDCRKSELIRAACDPDFPVLRCGANIAVISVEDAGPIADFCTTHPKSSASRSTS